MIHIILIQIRMIQIIIQIIMTQNMMMRIMMMQIMMMHVIMILGDGKLWGKVHQTHQQNFNRDDQAVKADKTDKRD